MLEVTTALGVTNPQIARGNTVVIRDSYGNPLVIVIESSENTTSVYTAEDMEKFKAIAKQLGIDRLAVCDTLEIDAWSKKPTGKLVL
jgi:hypothetical protein